MTETQKLCGALCRWYAQNSRALPFRQNPDAYSVWISEIMAQQTRIAALLPYYERFMQRFPSVWALANAPEDEVLRTWQGLGYYSRARNMQKAARIVCETYGGQLPKEPALLKKLPGIGDYTAGAIASIAYELSEPAVDGNVLRVFSRLFTSAVDVRTPVARKQAAGWIRECMREASPSIMTQAVMELGALVCLPGTPKCEICSLAPFCKAYREGTQHAYPLRTPDAPKKTETRLILLLQAPDDRVLLRRRTQRLLHNLWEFPGFSSEAEMRFQIETWGVEPSGEPIFVFKAKHVFTHLIWDMQGYACTAKNSPEITGAVWTSLDDIDRLAIPSAFSACLAWLGSALDGGPEGESANP